MFHRHHNICCEVSEANNGPQLRLSTFVLKELELAGSVYPRWSRYAWRWDGGGSLVEYLSKGRTLVGVLSIMTAIQLQLYVS